MCDDDLRKEILQSTQRLMNQIDQIKPIEINPEEIEKSQAFINRLENEQIQNIEKSNSLLRDVSDWGDKRKDQYDEFEKPLLKTVENSVHVSEEVTNSAIPLLQERINNYDRRLGDLKSSIASMGDAISKTAKEAYDMIKSGNEPNLKPEEKTPLLQFSPNSNLLSNDNNCSDNDDNDSQQKNINEDFDDDTSYDIIQSLKLREEHLLNVVKSLSNELKTLKNTMKTEQSMSKNLYFELEYIKKHKYSPTIVIDSENINKYEQYQNKKLQISSNNTNSYFDIPLIIIEHKDQLLGTKDFEELEEQTHELQQKIIMYQHFEIADLDPNQNFDLLKNRVVNEIKYEYYSNLTNQSIQNENNNYYNSIESFEIADIMMPQNIDPDGVGKVTIVKEKGSNHHIFNYSENMNSEQAADDLDDLIKFHRSCTNNENETESDDDEKESENDLKLQQLKLITDFQHAAKIVYNTKTGKREIVTEKNIRLELTPIKDKDNSFNFTSMNGQHLNVILTGHDNQKSAVDIKLNSDEMIDDRCIYIANETNENGEEIKLQVIVNKDGESYVTNNDLESENNTINSSIFFDSNGCSFIYDSTNSIRIPVFMNETGQIMYETSNQEFIQVAMMNLQSELYYVNENGVKMIMRIDEDGNFYVLSNNGQRILIDIFKNLNDQIKSENEKDENLKNNKRVEIITDENEQTEINQNSNDNDNLYQYQGSNKLSEDRLVPVSISRKDNELKIIYKDKEDAVVVNTSISHTTQDGQIILRPKTNPPMNQGSNLNLAVKGVKFNFSDDNPETRVTRIVGGFNKTFMRRSRRKKFNWTVRPARQIVKLNIEPNPPRCFYHQSYKDRLKNKNNNANENQPTSTNQNDVSNRNIPLRWMALPVRPPPPCCRKGMHTDLNLMEITPVTISASTEAPAQTGEQLIAKETENSNDKPKYIFNKKKIVQPESKQNRTKTVQEHFKSEQSGRKANININARNQKYPVSPSPRRQLQHQKMKHLAPLTPSLPLQMSIQPSPRIKFNVGDDCAENGNSASANINNQNDINIPTIELR